MGQPRTVQGTGQWYVIARHGDMVMRVRPRMSLGETETGELSFDASCAQLELDIADDGGLVLSAVGGHELEWAGGTRCHRERLARDRGAEIRLPHNVLLLDTDFVEEIPALYPIVDIAEPQTTAVRPVEDITEPELSAFPEVLLRNPVDAVVADPPPRSPGPDERAVGETSADLPTGRAGLHRQRIRSPSMAALVGVAGIGLALLYLALRQDGVPEPSAIADAAPVPQTAPARASSAVAESHDPRVDALPSPVPLPPKPQVVAAVDAPPAPESPKRNKDVAKQPVERLPAPARASSAVAESPDLRVDVLPAPVLLPPKPRVGAAPATEPESRKRNKDVAERPVERLPAPALVAAPAREPVVPPAAARLSVPQVAQIADPDEAVAIPKPIEKTIDTQPPAPVATGPQESSETTRTQAAEQARRRALFAADQALAQGRLTTPPETSAYALYNRVLALDPASAEARSGLQSVREGLINRALAELAGNALDDARSSLQAAADAGADPMLVTNLRDEVDYRQQLNSARAGQ